MMGEGEAATKSAEQDTSQSTEVKTLAATSVNATTSKRRRLKDGSQEDNIVQDDDTVEDSKQAGDDASEPEALTKSEIDQVRNSGAIAQDEQFLWEILAATRESALSKLQGIDDALERGNWAAAAKHCHTLKGSTAMMDLKKLWAACVHAEQCLKSMTSDELGLNDESRQAVAQVRRQILRLSKTNLNQTIL